MIFFKNNDGIIIKSGNKVYDIMKKNYPKKIPVFITVPRSLIQ